MILIPLEFKIGETFAPLPFLWQDVNGNPVNMTGYTASWVAKQDVGVPDPPYILAQTNPPGNGYEVINALNGSIQLIIPSSYTVNLASPFSGYWQQWVYSPSGVATCLFGGTLQVWGSLI